MTAEKIAELKRLWAAATQGEWATCLGSITIEDNGHIIEELAQFTGLFRIDNAWACADIHNAFPDIIAALEAAEAERDALQEESAYVTHQLEWVEENGDTYTKSALMDFIRRTLNAINHTSEIKEAVAARDARLKNEGAAEWLENAAREGVYYERSSEGMLEDAAELRRKGGE